MLVVVVEAAADHATASHRERRVSVVARESRVVLNQPVSILRLTADARTDTLVARGRFKENLLVFITLFLRQQMVEVRVLKTAERILTLHSKRILTELRDKQRNVPAPGDSWARAAHVRDLIGVSTRRIQFERAESAFRKRRDLRAASRGFCTAAVNPRANG